jgi:hypothetical protein
VQRLGVLTEGPLDLDEAARPGPRPLPPKVVLHQLEELGLFAGPGRVAAELSRGYQPRRFPLPNLVGNDQAPSNGRFEREQRGIDLVRIHVHELPLAPSQGRRRPRLRG